MTVGVVDYDYGYYRYLGLVFRYKGGGIDVVYP